MTEKEPLYFYKMMMTEEQYEDLKNILKTCSLKIDHVESRDKRLIKLCASVFLAQKEERE
jgi:hypothetical protein